MASLCKKCEEIQEQLLAGNEGAGGQIICNHQDDQTIMVIEDEEGEDGESSGESTFSAVSAAVDMKPKQRDSRKRKFPTMKTFAATIRLNEKFYLSKNGQVLKSKNYFVSKGLFQ